MGITRETGKVITEVVGGLKNQPIALSLVVVNVLYLLAGGWLVSTILERAEQRDTLLVKLAVRECAFAPRRE